MTVLTGWSCSGTEKHFLLNIDANENRISGPAKLSSIFTYRNLIKLDTSYHLGNIVKIIKRDRNFYVLSNYKSVFFFDQSGKATGRIDNVGNGPEEYNQILDFDVHGYTVYILSYKKIFTYNLKGEYTGQYDLSFIANQFICTNNGILYKTSGKNTVLTFAGYKGNIISEFLKPDLTNRLCRNVQFTKISNEIVVYQMAYTNDIVILNSENGHFENKKLTNIPGSLGYGKYESLLRIFGDAADNHYGNSVCFDGITSYKEHIAFPYLSKEKIYLCNYDLATSICKTFPAGAGSKIVNDITFTDLNFLQTFSLTVSDDCLLVYIYPYKIEEKIGEFLRDYPQYDTSAYFNFIKSMADSSSDDDNPILVELKI
ncbi:MAG TPA: 6-bladed beta-propeller [Bacteroidales bacterium]|nr:6-bladed beta-propeller [Bacteroidales bacterium]